MGKKKVIDRSDAYASELSNIEKAVEEKGKSSIRIISHDHLTCLFSPETITMNDTSDGSVSPLQQELAWWKNQNEAVASLPKLPKNTAATLGVRRGHLVEKIRKQLKELSQLESRWNRNRASVKIAKHKDTRFYGRPEEAPEPPPQPPYVIDAGTHHLLLFATNTDQY
jgi:hypothetical protein